MNDYPSSVDEDVDDMIANETEQANPDELVSKLHPDLFFRKNSVNLIIGRRGSGKTHLVLREILKCVMLGFDEYTQLYYVSDKAHDDTVQKLQPLLEQYLDFYWVPTKDASSLMSKLEIAKTRLDNSKISAALNAQGMSRIPHTFILFDDCIGLFSKTNELARKLYQTRQSRITAFLLLQDTSGLNPSMKSNMDALILFGGFPKHKYSILFYQMPPVNLTFEEYAELETKDAVIIDFASNNVKFHYRH